MKTSTLLIVALIILLKQTSYSEWELCNGPLMMFNEIKLNDKTLYAATYIGLYFSEDNGDTWEALALSGTNIKCIEFLDNKIFVGTTQGLLFSTDKGINWYKTSLNNIHIQSIKVFYNDIFVVVYDTLQEYEVTNSTVYLSSDAGISWTEINNGIPENTVITSIAINERFIIIGTKDNKGIYRLEENGGKWVNLYNFDDEYNLVAVMDDKIFVSVLAKNYGMPTSPRNDIYCSTDSGQSWEIVKELGHFPYLLIVSGNNIYVNTYNGIYVSSNKGLDWIYVRFINSYFVFFEPKTVINFDGITIVGVSGYRFGGTFKAVNNLLYPWTSLFQSITDKKTVNVQTNGNNVFAYTWYDGLFLSTNSGDTWKNIYVKYDSYSDDNAMFIKGDTIILCELGINISTNLGETWYRPINSGLSSMEEINSVLLFEENIFISTHGKFKTANGKVYLSTDFGENWVEKTNGLTLGEKVNMFGLTKYDSILVVSASNAIYRSTDYGETWFKSNLEQSASYTMIDKTLYAISVDKDKKRYVYKSDDYALNWYKISDEPLEYTLFGLKSNGKTLFAKSQYYGVFLSTDYGYTWIQYMDGMDIQNSTPPSTGSITQIAFSDNNYVFASNFDYGIYRRKLDDFVSVDDIPIANEDFIIQIYPNPVSNELNIVLNSEIQYKANISIYDMIGRKVKEFYMNNNFTSINLSELAVGTYICVININGVLRSKTFSVLE